MTWILVASGKWHAWPTGGQRTQCGRVNCEHLRVTPAVAIKKELPAEALVCVVCAKKAHVTRVVMNDCGNAAKAWMGLLQLQLRQMHVSARLPAIQQLAMRLAEIGAPSEADARDVFTEIRPLLLTPFINRRKSGKRTVRTASLPQLSAALNKLPPRYGVLREIALAMRTWRTITQRDPTVDRFRPDRVVETMLQIPDIEAYVKHLHSKDFSHLAAVFHPNTLERAKKDTALRGIFGGSSTYWDQTRSSLNIVTD